MTYELRGSMTENEEKARAQADHLYKAIYEALRDGFNISVTVNDPLPHCSGNSFWTDKRVSPLNGAEQ